MWKYVLNYSKLLKSISELLSKRLWLGLKRWEFFQKTSRCNVEFEERGTLQISHGFLLMELRPWLLEANVFPCAAETTRKTRNGEMASRGCFPTWFLKMVEVLKSIETWYHSYSYHSAVFLSFFERIACWDLFPRHRPTTRGWKLS